MSGLVGPDGKTPIQSDLPQKEFRAGGLQFGTVMTPDMLLNKAIQGAAQAIAQQTYQAVAQRLSASPLMKVPPSQIHSQATAEAQKAAAKVRDPFTLEPAAMAVFMYLSREIEYRDMLIGQISERLQGLGAEPLDLTHPYPVPPPKESESEDEGDEEEDGDESGGDEAPPPTSTLAN